MIYFANRNWKHSKMSFKGKTTVTLFIFINTKNIFTSKGLPEMQLMSDVTPVGEVYDKV